MDLFRRIFSKPSPESQPSEKADTPMSSASDEQLPPTQELPPPPETDAPELDETAPFNPPVNMNGVTRPLPPEPTLPLNLLIQGRATYGQESDQGLVRTNNQDAAYTFFGTSLSDERKPQFGLFIVADGMGGHQMGEKASALAIRVVTAQVLQKIYTPLLNTEDDTGDRPTIAEALIHAVQTANEKVLKYVNGSGTTTTAMIVMGNLAHLVHVGDSRAYLITPKDIEQLTRDHSLAQRLIELGQLTQEEAKDHPQRNVLYRAIGQMNEIEVDTLTRRLQPGVQVLLCSDGLWGWVSDEEIFEVVNSVNHPQEACEKLVALANTNGSQDNITAVIFKMPG
jgi:PPM family protein phosphatase